MRFADIPGLDELKHQLVHSFEKGKVAHAQLFSGTSGTAVSAIAQAYATFLMCQNKNQNDACGTCPNCARMEKYIHPDVHWYFPKIAASDSGKYDKVLAEALPIWRLFLANIPYGSFEDWSTEYAQENKNLQLSREDSRQVLKNVSMRSVEGGYKIIFIWGIEYMHPTGANALLKVLEEPPEKTIYLLVTFNYDLLLQTITSRSQLVNVPPHNPDAISTHLLERHNADEEQAKQLAKISQGRIRVALNLLQSEEKMAYVQFRDWMLACWNRDFTSLVSSSEEFSKNPKIDQRGFLTYSLSLIRNALLKLSGSQPVVINQEEDSFIAKYADRLGMQKLEDVYKLLNDALQHLDRNSNPRITHLNLSLSILRKINS